MTLLKEYRWAALAVAAVTLASACAPGIRVTRLQPSRVNLGATRRIAILDVNGVPDAVATTMSELQRQIVDRRYYTLINAMNQGLTISIAGTGARIDISNVRQQVDADVYIVASIKRFELIEQQKREDVTENGRKRTVTKITPEARARIAFQLVKADGQVLAIRDYDGTESGSAREVGSRASYSAGDLYESAIKEAVASFLSDVTPRQVVEKIELDESDPALEPGIKLAEAGDLAGAEQSWAGVLSQNPNSAGAIYNIGVLLETRGEFDQAAANYQRAHQISPKSLYRDAIEDLNQRIRDAESLQQQI